MQVHIISSWYNDGSGEVQQTIYSDLSMAQAVLEALEKHYEGGYGRLVALKTVDVVEAPAGLMKTAAEWLYQENPSATPGACRGIHGVWYYMDSYSDWIGPFTNQDVCIEEKRRVVDGE